MYGLYVMYLQIKNPQFQVVVHLQHSKMLRHASIKCNMKLKECNTVNKGIYSFRWGEVLNDLRICKKLPSWQDCVM